MIASSAIMPTIIPKPASLIITTSASAIKSKNTIPSANEKNNAQSARNVEKLFIKIVKPFRKLYVLFY